jgi:hypothetical protein
MKLRRLREKLAGALEQRQSLDGVAVLRGEHAEQVQGVGIVRLICEDAAVSRLGVRGAPGLVVGEGALKNFEGFLRGHRDLTGECTGARANFTEVRIRLFGTVAQSE